MSNETTTIPAAITVLSGETLPISIDFSTLINGGQTPFAPTMSLKDIDTGANIILGTVPVITLNVVTQTVQGLTAGHRYRLVLGLTAVTGVVWQAGVLITCPF
jgi:hypothetical protein